MPPQNPNPISETSILTNFLLGPSTFPNIISYSAFKELAKHVSVSLKDSSDLRRLYRELQFQRDITLDQVRDAIERESTLQAANLKIRLAKQIAIEDGEVGEGKPRKRRRFDNGESGSDDDSSSSDDLFDDPVLIAAQKTMYHHPDSSHPASRVMPMSGENLQRNLRIAPRSAYHTKESLLREMAAASRSVEGEIAELEAECERLNGSITETVGGLSDLRYGKRQSAGEEGVEMYKEVLDAIEQFRGVVRASAKT